MSRKFSKDEMKRLVDEEYKKLTELADKDPVAAVQAIIAFYRALGYTGDEIDRLMSKQVTPEAKVVSEVEEKVLPEGVTLLKFELQNEKYAEMITTIFDAIESGKYDFRSAVNLKTMVRTVMYEKDAKTGTPIEVYAKDTENAWLLQQAIAWAHSKAIKVVATKKEGNFVEVAYIKLGWKKPIPEEKYLYRFKKTDGWKLTGEEKPYK